MQKVKITTEDLLAQSNEMMTLQNEYSGLFSGVSSELNKVNCNWSANLAHNFLGKIVCSSNIFLKITKDLINAANAAKMSAETFEAIDRELAKMYGNDELSNKLKKETTTSDTVEPVDMNYYMQNVTDAEYARLCGMWSSVSNKKDPRKAFIKKLQELPENDPLRSVKPENLLIYNDNDSGFSAVAIIGDDRKDALVIFAGTNEDMGDYAADVSLVFNASSVQSEQAIYFVDQVSQMCSNVQVTGWSLGGYLATSATLKNSSVSRCVAFDPPGRYDTIQQALTNSSRTSKVTTYEAHLSPVSKVGIGVGKVKHLKVKINWCGPALNHGIEEISNALGGESAINKSWNQATMGGR